MAVAEIELPDGRIATFEVPDGMAPEEVQAQAQAQFEAGAFDAAQPEPAPQERQTIQAGVPFMTDDGPAILRNGQIEILSQQEADLITGAEQTAGEIGREAVADPNIVERGTILPFGKTASGETTFAVPEILMAGPQAVATGVAALAGAPITGAELAETTLAAAIPAAGGIKGVAKIARSIPKDIVKEAKSTKQLLKEGGDLIQNYVKTGDEVSSDDFSLFWIKADDVLKRAGFDAETTPAIARQMNSLARRAENEFTDPQEMVNIRRGIRSLLKSPNIEPEDKRLASILLDEFDDFVLTLPGSSNWKKGRAAYQKGKKSEQIETALELAGETASGLENGIRIELRKILKSPKKLRGFTDAEKSAMRDIVKGNFTRNSLRRLAVMSFGSGQQRNPFAMISQVAGAGAGGMVGGVPGAIAGGVLPGAVGSVAQKALEKSTVGAVNALRALAAGAKIPERILFKDTQLTPRILSGLLAAGAAQ